MYLLTERNMSCHISSFPVQVFSYLISCVFCYFDVNTRPGGSRHLVFTRSLLPPGPVSHCRRGQTEINQSEVSRSRDRSRPIRGQSRIQCSDHELIKHSIINNYYLHSRTDAAENVCNTRYDYDTTFIETWESAQLNCRHNIS